MLCALTVSLRVRLAGMMLGGSGMATVTTLEAVLVHWPRLRHARATLWCTVRTMASTASSCVATC